ncbi:MAG: hypothetical protein V4857_07720 [Pseudomonadota bacterium]
MNHDDILKQLAKSIGSAPRKFNFIDKLTWFKQDLPEWDWQSDDIRHSVENWRKVFEQGRLTWGHIVQVNRLMFEESDANCPGEVLIWHDRSAFNLRTFAAAAAGLYDLKGTSDELGDADEKAFAEQLEDELIRGYGTRIPARLAHGFDLRASTIFFQRRHIPNRVITGSLFPILYLEESPMVAVMVPHRFWPKELLEAW